MKNNWFTYIKIFKEGNYIQSSGITFNTFYNAISDKPQNILILKGYPNNALTHNELGLEFIPIENIENFINNNIYDYGDFCWVDFDNTEQLDNLSNDQLAELLFFSHKVKPLRFYQINDLKNKYAYYSHDDDWFVRIFMEDVKKYLPVIEHKILLELKGRKKYISPLPEDILGQIYGLAKEGVVIDFENSYSTGVRIYKIENIDNMDTIHELLDKKRKRLRGLCLDYSTVSKKWNVY